MKQVPGVSNAIIVGFSISNTQTSNVVVDASVSNVYEAPSGRQEWPTVIECILATGGNKPRSTSSSKVKIS